MKRMFWVVALIFLVVMGVNAQTVNLTWTASSTSGVDYDVYRSTTSGSGYQPLASNVAALTYTDASALTAGTTYYYVVRSTLNGVESTNSNEASATIPGQTPPPTGFSIAVHSGGAAYTDSTGLKWAADEDFNGGNVYGTSATITGTPDPKLYQNERFGVFTYNFAVPNGSYNVTLKFAEIYFSTTGSRVFNVSINGTQVLTNFDIVAAAGGMDKALDKTFPVTVTNGAIAIAFTNGTANNPKVSAVEITSAGPVTPPTPPAPPTGISEKAAASVTLTWTAESNVTGYNVYRATVAGGPYTKITPSPVTSTSYQDGSVTVGTGYFYVVTAVSAGGESSYSTPVNVTP